MSSRVLRKLKKTTDSETDKIKDLKISNSDSDEKDHEEPYINKFNFVSLRFSFKLNLILLKNDKLAW